MLYNLSANKKLHGYYKYFQKFRGAKAGNDTLKLPFKEDFTKDYYFPDPDKWSDINTYVNRTYGVQPHSYGVVTFDGLDSTGYPYNFVQPTAQGLADYLTSKSIDLSAALDSVYLSFFYQPQGRGNMPDDKDSLVLEFFNVLTGKWEWQWSVKGQALAPFRQVMLFVDTVYQTNAFKFRFKNYATLSGSVDHWHVDYIYLNEGRTYNDTIYHDVTFKDAHVNFIKNYEAMPWWHYKQDTINNMEEFVTLKAFNYNPNQGYAINYKYRVYNEAGVMIEEQPVGDPFFTINTAPDSVTIPNEIYKPIPAGATANDFYFPPYDSTTTFFLIKNYFALDKTTTPKFDFNQENDTIMSFQKFGNYYARDDGSAEAGYGLQGANGELAYKFTTKIKDTLTGVYIYFNPIRDDRSASSFKLKVWASDLTTILFQESYTVSPQYSFFNEFIYYKFSSPLVVSGTFYVGFEKITADPMNLGFDFNIDNSSNLYYNVSGTWSTTSFKGSLMLRPVFRGHVSNPVASVEEEVRPVTSAFDVKVYPNPSRDVVNINVVGVQSAAYRYELYDLMGKKVLERLGNGTLQLNDLAPGVFVVNVTDCQTGSSVSERLIVSP